MTTPKRVVRRRTRGWRLPPGCVIVSRPSKWGNPYKVQREENGGLIYYVIAREGKPVSIMAWDTPESAQRQAVEWFEIYAKQRLRDDPTWLDPLRGKDLACWCAENESCHADALLALVAQEGAE